MAPKNLRFLGSIALFGFLFLFFVPLVYDATMFPCTRGCGGFDCGLCFSNPAGLKSIGYALFHWGGIYSLEYFPQLSGYAFSEGNFAFPDATAILVFVALPIAIAGAGLLEPEIVRKFRPAGIGFVVLGLFALIVAANSFSLAYHGFGLAFDLLGAALSLTGVAIILYLHGAGWSIRTGQPDPDRG